MRFWQLDGAPVVVKDLLLQGSARAPQKYDLEVKLWCLDLSCTWQKLSQISPKSPLYIGGRGRRLALRAKPSRVRRPRERRSPTPILLQLGLESGVLLFLPTSHFFYFLWFSSLGAKALLGCPTNPLRAGAPPVRPLGFPRVGCPPPGELLKPIRHSWYIPGNARKPSGNQMKSSYISIFISGPFRKPS